MEWTLGHEQTTSMAHMRHARTRTVHQMFLTNTAHGSEHSSFDAMVNLNIRPPILSVIISMPFQFNHQYLVYEWEAREKNADPYFLAGCQWTQWQWIGIYLRCVNVIGNGVEGSHCTCDKQMNEREKKILAAIKSRWGHASVRHLLLNAIEPPADVNDSEHVRIVQIHLDRKQADKNVWDCHCFLIFQSFCSSEIKQKQKCSGVAQLPLRLSIMMWKLLEVDEI